MKDMIDLLDYLIADASRNENFTVDFNDNYFDQEKILRTLTQIKEKCR